MSTAIRLVCVFCAALSLTGCAPMLAMLGSNTSFVALATQVERIKLAADGASLVRWDKTLTDYALSQATGKECRIFNILAIESVCVEKTPVIAADSDALPKEVATGAAPADPATLPTEVATVTPAHSDALPKEIAASVAPAESHTHATIAPARSFEFSREQASGD